MGSESGSGEGNKNKNNKDNENKKDNKNAKIMKIIILLIVLSIASAVLMIFNKHALSMALFFSAIFLLVLYIMDAMTKKAREDFIKNKNIVEELKSISEKLDKKVDEDTIRRLNLILLYLEDSLDTFSKREIRRALAFSITMFYFTVISLAIFGNVPDTVVSNVSLVFLVVIAFYFGSRAVEDGIKLYKALRGGGR